MRYNNYKPVLVFSNIAGHASYNRINRITVLIAASREGARLSAGGNLFFGGAVWCAITRSPACSVFTFVGEGYFGCYFTGSPLLDQFIMPP